MKDKNLSNRTGYRLPDYFHVTTKQVLLLPILWFRVQKVLISLYELDSQSYELSLPK